MVETTSELRHIYSEPAAASFHVVVWTAIAGDYVGKYIEDASFR